MEKIWRNSNLALITIAATLTLYSILDEHIVTCSANALVGDVCTGWSVWALTEKGTSAISSNVTTGMYLVNTVKGTTVTHFIVSAIGMGLYALRMDFIGSITTALGHICGWVLLAVVLTEEVAAREIIDVVMPDDYSGSDFTFGMAMISSIIATSLQLLAVLSTIGLLYYKLN